MRGRRVIPWDRAHVRGAVAAGGARPVRSVPVNRLRPVPTRSLRIALDEAREIARVTVPLIVLHGDADTLVPISQGRAVEHAAGSRDKRFVVVPGARHNDVFYANTPPAGDAIASFLAAR